MMRWLLILAIMATSAQAGTKLDPPARFDHAFQGQLTEHRIARDNVWAECSQNGRFDMRRDVAGCSLHGDGWCEIWLAMRTKRAPVEAIRRHEISHCNGWTQKHED